MTDMSADPVEQKARLRERLRFRRRHFAEGLGDMARMVAFRALPAPLLAIASKHQIVGAYAAWGDEPDILPMLGGFDIALPYHAARVATMNFRRWDPAAPLTKGPWGTPQPADDSAEVQPTLILCPLVGFDRTGGRLGQGGGHYDRFFASHPGALRIGIGWAVQEIDSVPVESTDAPLDAVLTEQEFMRFGDRL
ncbi:MAG: 5-formyltetrahydrofolate cyclo-ligase [Sphingopyxis sp.]|uniref:5-formyltetrahydrofolate cyclo-ligase n=1 Tax=Sphingopyxis sp. TaxID=1908224 RepID=UPI002ABAEA91|nr:5-formyltetrahydrofolate cyclo-ligase [Sphingopyxis sp.]MDZ3830967.1 5-formyltetrahydrofolate cyclo-ligase [Sphingopyxis sp.]